MNKNIFLLVFILFPFKNLFSQKITVQKNYDAQNPDERRRTDVQDYVNQIRAEL